MRVRVHVHVRMYVYVHFFVAQNYTKTLGLSTLEFARRYDGDNDNYKMLMTITKMLTLEFAHIWRRPQPSRPLEAHSEGP